MNRFLSKIVLTSIILMFSGCNSSSNSNQGMTQFDKILKEKRIRCSYLIYPPYFMKDPNSGAMSGIFYDIMEKIGHNSSLKIEWTEDVGYENIFPGLESDRYDVFAGGLWPNSTRAKVGDFSIPVFFSIIKAWGRADETRFINDLDAINNAKVKIATIDGAMEDIISKNDFPLAERVSLPQLSPFTQNLQNIISGKADLTFAEPGIVYEFLEKNPETLKELAPNKPLRIFGNCLVIKKNENDLKDFLDVSLQELLYCGEIDRILKKYESNINVFPRIALPYRVENTTEIPYYLKTK